jgi:hypothetical protein
MLKFRRGHINTLFRLECESIETILNVFGEEYIGSFRKRGRIGENQRNRFDVFTMPVTVPAVPHRRTVANFGQLFFLGGGGMRSQTGRSL